MANGRSVYHRGHIARSKAGPLLSICVASYRPESVHEQLENLSKTVFSPESLEYLVKIDDGDQEMRALLEGLKTKYDFPIKVYSSPKSRGYYSLHYAYNELSRMSAGYFLQLLNDGIRYETRHWDKILAQYRNIYRDHIFRIRISKNRNRDYQNLNDALHHPDSYAFYTRDWIDTVGGWASGRFWGADSWQEGINYFLENEIELKRTQVCERIQIHGEDYASELSYSGRRKRAVRSYNAFDRLLRKSGQEEFFRLSRNLEAKIEVRKRKLPCRILEDRRKKTVVIPEIHFSKGYRLRWKAEHFSIFFWNNRVRSIGYPVNKLFGQKLIKVLYALPFRPGWGIRSAISWRIHKYLRVPFSDPDNPC